MLTSGALQQSAPGAMHQIRSRQRGTSDQTDKNITRMRTIKGPGIFLAQFLGDQPPFNSLPDICKWVAGLGYIGVQLPSWDSRVIDLQKAAESKTYADEIKGIVSDAGLQITELSTHLQGQLVAVHPRL